MAYVIHRLVRCTALGSHCSTWTTRAGSCDAETNGWLVRVRRMRLRVTFPMWFFRVERCSTVDLATCACTTVRPRRAWDSWPNRLEDAWVGCALARRRS